MTRFAIDPACLVRLGRDGADVRHQLVAPSSIRSRALDLLMVQVRRGTLSASAALAAHTAMTERKIRILGDRVSRRTAWDLALDRDGVTVCDAEYVAVAKLQADALVTTDRRLRSIARGVVALASYDDLLD